jgi:hypothetical protein
MTDMANHLHKLVLPSPRIGAARAEIKYVPLSASMTPLVIAQPESITMAAMAAAKSDFIKGLLFAASAKYICSRCNGFINRQPCTTVNHHGA